jgi:AcrR family transcriptional regulator
MSSVVQTKEVKEAILDAADRLLSTFGYKKMTIDDLAREVGIGKGSIYLHFPSKEEIALSHIDRIVERVTDELKTIAVQDVSFDDRLKQMLLARVLLRFDSVQHYTRSLNDLLVDLRFKLLARRKSHFAGEAEIFAVVIEDGQKKNVFRDGNALEIAESFLLATNSLLPFSLTAKELGERAEIAEKTGRLAEILLRGISKN